MTLLSFFRLCLLSASAVYYNNVYNPMNNLLTDVILNVRKMFYKTRAGSSAVELWTENPGVTGSIPVLPTI